MNNIIIESLRRLYVNQKNDLTNEQIENVKNSADRLLQAQKITNEEYHYILGKDGE